MPTVIDGSLGVTYPVTAGGTSAVQASSSKILQVVNATYGTYTTNATSTYADTGLTASITPSSSSSKILVFANVAGCGKTNSNTVLLLRLLRGSTVISKMEGAGGFTSSTATNNFGSCNITYLDSPATTSSTTYKVQFASSANTSIVETNNFLISNGDSVSTITLMEIAA